MATTSTTSVTVFNHYDAGYLAWLAGHRDGYVVNCNETPAPNYLKLHRATCTWINPPKFRNWTTVGFIKVCAPTVADLAAWALVTTGGTLQPCKSCMPGTRSGQTDWVRPAGAPAPDPRPVGVPDAIQADGEDALILRSGLRIENPEARLLNFCREEYAYYDGIADADPDHVLPVDVLATIAMNSFIDKAAQVRRIHRGLAAACDPLLLAIPEDADLLTFDPSLQAFRGLLHAAVQVPEVLIPRAVKVLHRKRRNFIPMLDTVVINYYLDATGRTALREKCQDKAQAAVVATGVLQDFREDLRECIAEITGLQSKLALSGYDLTPVRILEVLVWTETEPQGYYRKDTTPPPRA